MSGSRTLLSLDEAFARVLASTSVLEAETAEVHSAMGRVLSMPAVSPVDLPPFPSSAMDGFAVRSAETPGALPVAFHVAAGSPAPGPLPAGSASGIATGGAVPDGADAVVPVEDVRQGEGEVTVPAIESGRNVRPRGSDASVGDVVAPAGARLGVAQIGALAALGLPGVRCARRPRVAVIPTGSELRAAGEALRPGEIYESNGAMLAASLSSVGARVEVLPVAGDDAAAHRSAIADGLTYDVLVTSGGVSVGPHDLVRRIEEELGVSEVFWGVAVKPGKPLSFGTYGATLVFGLPGNPVSALVGSLLFVQPAILALQGASAPGPAWEPGVAGRSLQRDEQRDVLVRSCRRLADDRVVLDPVGGQESHMIARTAAADALALVPRGEGSVSEGSPVRYLSLA